MEVMPRPFQASIEEAGERLTGALHEERGCIWLVLQQHQINPVGEESVQKDRYVRNLSRVEEKFGGGIVVPGGMEK
jgi:hypothetical protein